MEFLREQSPVEYHLREAMKALSWNMEDQNLIDTPYRVEKFWKEAVWSWDRIQEELDKFKKAVFNSKLDQMIIEKNIRVLSVCPHHLLPVEYSVDVAYIPSGKVIGLSKLARTAVVLGKGLMLQEDYTDVLKKTLQQLLDTEDVAVRVLGRHYCMIARGVKQKDACVETISLGGKFLEESVKVEFLQGVRNV